MSVELTSTENEQIQYIQEENNRYNNLYLLSQNMNTNIDTDDIIRPSITSTHAISNNYVYYKQQKDPERNFHERDPSYLASVDGPSNNYLSYNALIHYRGFEQYLHTKLLNNIQSTFIFNVIDIQDIWKALTGLSFIHGCESGEITAKNIIQVNTNVCASELCVHLYIKNRKNIG